MKPSTLLKFFTPAKLLLMLLLMLGVAQANAQKKIVGYYPTGASASGVDFAKITHLMLEFENPDDAGNLSYNGGNDALITAAHNNGVKVLVSICGGGCSTNSTYQARYTNLMSPTNRAGFISKIVSYLNAHNLDGIDLDLEGDAINIHYNDFVAALNSSLPAGKLLTCALSHTNGGDRVSNAAAQIFDFVGVMAYDNFWGQAMHHSTYEFAETSAAWWVNTKGVARANVILGVPFYGYTGTTGAGDITFAQILANYGSAAAQQDTWAGNAGTIYYNGIPTIRRKSQLVVDQNYGGIMIWQLAQDATGSNSLLTNIKQVLDQACTVPAQPGTISGNTTVTAGTSQTYSIAAVATATSYTWTLPSGWSGSSTGTSITTTSGSTGGTITVRANNSCGAGPTRSLAVTVTSCTLPAQPGTISGNTTVAAGSSQTYSIGAVATATSYTWTLPSGWSGSSTGTSITTTAGSAGGTITVRANNSCGAGPTRSLAVTIGTPSSNLALNKAVTVSSVEPGTTFTGANAVDGNGATRWSSNYVDPSWIYVNLGASYSVNRVRIVWEAAFATAYRVEISSDANTWSPMRTVTGNATTVNDLTGLSGTGQYVRIYGTARNSTWGYSIFELEVYGTGGCSPSTITPHLSVNGGTWQQTSTATLAAGGSVTMGPQPATGGSWSWAGPGGYTATTREITRSNIQTTQGGNYIATHTNSCGAQSTQTFTITVTSCTLPAQPGTISGNTSVTAGSSNTYSIAGVSGATSYTWTLPSGWSGSSTTTSITTTAGSAGGTITVRANNSCGAGPTRSLTVTVGSSTTNRALGRPVNVTSVEAGTTFVGTNAVDGNTTTRWSSAYSDPQSIVVDLGAMYAVNRVKITWEAAYGVDYRVQISSDGAAWSDMRVVTNNATLVNDHTGLTGTGRYVAVYGTRRSSQWGYSIFELEVYGNPTGGRSAGDLSATEVEESSEKIELFPMPVENTLFIKTQSDFKGGLMKIMNTSGVEFVSTRVEEDGIDVSSLPTGFYVLRLSKDKKVATKKFIKK